MISFFDQYLPFVMKHYQRFALDFRFMQPRMLRYPYRYMHYYYPLEQLAEDVFAETSVIGKHRYDKNGNHQLDRYALSKDEASTFDMLARKASADVYEKLVGNSSDNVDCNIYDEDNTIVVVQNNGKHMTINSVTTSDLVFRMTLDSVGDHKLKVAAIIANEAGITIEEATELVEEVESGTPTVFIEKITEYDADRIEEQLVDAGASVTQEQYQETQDLAQLHFNITLDKNLEPEDEFYIRIKYAYTVSNFMQEPELRTGEYLYEQPWASGDADQFDVFVILPLELDKSSSQMPGVYPETLISLDDYKYDASIRFSHPDRVEPGKYIEYHFEDGSVQLYVAKNRPPFPPRPPFAWIWTLPRPRFWRPFHLPPRKPDDPLKPIWKPLDLNDDFNNPMLYAKMDDDFRHSVHYIVKKYEYTRENSVKLVDNAILSCLRYHIIQHWLEMIAPEVQKDIDTYKARYEDSLMNLKLYICMTERINIISHPY